MNNKGFTLVELLATIVVLGIVTSITIVTVNVSTDGSKEKSEEVFKANIEKAIESYISANSSKYSGCNDDDNTNCNFKFNELINNGYLDEKKVVNPNNSTDCNIDADVNVTAQYDTNEEFKKYCFKVSLDCVSEINTCEYE